MSTSDLSWLKQLPTFPYLPQESPSLTSTLIKPFSLFSLFRSSSPLPPSKLLGSLHSLADGSGTEYPAANLREEVLKAVQDFHTYIAKIQLAADDQRNVEALQERLNELAKGYLACFYVSFPIASTSSHPHSATFRKIVQDSLRAVFIYHDHLSPLSHPIIHNTLDPHILAASFPPSAAYYYLTPLLEVGRTMVDRLSVATRTIKSKVDTSCGVPEDDAIFIYELLKTAGREIKSLGRLGPEGKTKAAKQDARRRALRLSMEMDVWRAELAFAMTNANMAAVKARAGVVEADSEGTELDTKEEQVEQEDEVDIKPKLDPEDDEISIPDAPLVSSPHIQLDLNGISSANIKWEDLTEETLVTLLQEARELVEVGNACVLSDKVERGDWLGHLPEEIPLPTTPTRRSKSLSHSTDTEAIGDGNDDDESDSESSSEVSEESLEEPHTCPLRSVFSLYDRFEEQRLAVWTSLPQSATAHKGRRKEMETYMRGTDGLAGEAGEALGLVLLIEYDRQSLIGYGLSYDKLDKWLELASNRNAKKIKRRKPAATTTTRAKAPAKRGRHRKTGSVASMASLDVPPAMRTRGRSKTPALSIAGSSRGGASKRGRGKRAETAA